MKKKISYLFFTALLLVGLTANAQFDKGDKIVNVGINLGSQFGGGFGAGASFESGITDFIGVGAQVDFVTWSSGLNYNFITVAAKGAYHFGKHFIDKEELDLYGGLALGYRISNHKASNVWLGSIYGNGFHFGPFVGTRYYFKPKMGVFAELGWNASPLKAGLAFKL